MFEKEPLGELKRKIMVLKNGTTLSKPSVETAVRQQCRLLCRNDAHKAQLASFNH
jgi:hypothetical protein